MPNHRRIVTALALVSATAITACDRGDAAELSNPARLGGRYTYAGRGASFGIPWDFTARIEFDRHGEFELTVDALIRDEAQHETGRGSYVIRGDSVLLRSDKDTAEEHALVIRGDSLVADLSWKGKMAMRIAGVPDPVFVKDRR